MFTKAGAWTSSGWLELLAALLLAVFAEFRRRVALDADDTFLAYGLYATAALALLRGLLRIVRVDNVVIDLTKRRYSIQRAKLGWMRSHTGSLDEFEYLCIEQEGREEHGGRLGYPVWVVYLAWKDPKRKAISLRECTSRDQALADEQRLSEKLGIQAIVDRESRGKVDMARRELDRWKRKKRAEKEAREPPDRGPNTH